MSGRPNSSFIPKNGLHICFWYPEVILKYLIKLFDGPCYYYLKQFCVRIVDIIEKRIEKCVFWILKSDCQFCTQAVPRKKAMPCRSLAQSLRNCFMLPLQDECVNWCYCVWIQYLFFFFKPFLNLSMNRMYKVVPCRQHSLFCHSVFCASRLFSLPPFWKEI